ncbi:putative glycosyl transferase [Microbacterium laevaniformans]|uniref:Putative glycosyl transferase n=1 Tax=Microbacterium laevaniformans TaxID=36807 RepID=A0A150HD49_9MICO|nr:glycosyltransferase family 2 protein [Microbacterium laevaniformans]KXZ59935.1 putative glycosyl transferase [Microbacterium laevaniformans]
MSFAAVVVSYNRLPLLKKCLTALEKQSHPLDEIIVIDNGSTDGSADYIRTTHPEVTLFETSTNLGGAGGFAWGIELALARGHEAAWLMDDDAEPELDAAAPLIDSFQSQDLKPAFIASLVTAGRGKFNKRNPPVVSTDPQHQVRAADYGGFAIQTATFVGVMINLEEASRTHLPMADYFIWMDDSEYTHRLSDSRFAMLLPDSMVNHPDNKPISNDMGERLFYFTRNRLWYTRSRTSAISTDILEIIGVALHAIKQFPIAASKKTWFSSVTRGFWCGFFQQPRKVMPGELIATLPDAERKRLGI